MSDVQIFQAFSLLYLAIGVGMFLNPDFYKKMFAEFCESGSIWYLGGIMALVVGYLIVAFHNTWTKDFSVIITVIGWMGLIKGILIFVFPKSMIGLTKAIFGEGKNLKIAAIFIIILGLALSFLGFCPKSPI